MGFVCFWAYVASWLAQSQLGHHLLIVASEEGEATAEKCRDEEEERSHRGETVRDLTAETQADSPPEVVVP